MRTAAIRMVCAAAVFACLAQGGLRAAGPATQGFALRKGDRIAIIGNTLADRMQHSGWLETYVHAIHPDLDLVFRNLAFSADELKLRPREDNFGTPDQWLEKTRATVVFCFFGYNEALKGPGEVPRFRKELAETIDGMLGQKYDGQSPPRLVFFSPIAHEDLKSPHLPDGSANNATLAPYTAAMREVCQEKGVAFVDLFAPTRELYGKASTPLTMNGVHLLEHGDRAVAEVIAKELLGAAKPKQDEAFLERLRQAVLDRNYYWFSRYRVVDGYNVFGGRSKLAWFGQSNADVMMREMEIFDVMTANRDARVIAVAKGGDLVVKDDNLPAELEVKTNIPGTLEGGKHQYLGGKEAIGKMTVAEGMEVNLFASEEMFPEIVNPVQMAVDTDGRLFVSVWPSYPHWNPKEPRRDKIVCLPDDNGDGVADRCVTFADELNSVTGFEFWGGGMIVAALPELWFLKDTDGDGKADVKVRLLQGLCSADSHHSANAMLVGPDGWLYWSRGIFNVSAHETPTRTFRSGSSGVYRFNPRTYEIEFHFPIGPNPHGDVFDQWGYQFANDGTGGTGSYVNIGKGIGNKQWFQKRVRPVPATGILSSSHFPEKNQGNFLICNSIGFLGVLQHEVKYNGADITATEIEPIVVSSDPNFRPTDLEVGADGALYVSDWANAIIGHMQHNMRDPNRDHTHGRIYRVTAKGRPLVEPVRLKGKPIADVCRQAFFAKENGTRYRGRLELSGRPTAEVVAAVGSWAKTLDPAKPDHAQAMLECLWVFEEHRVPNGELLRSVFAAAEPRVRAAAIRTLGHWGPQVSGWEPVLLAAARDEAALVRAEAVKAAVSFEGPAAAEAFFEVASRPTDPELDTVIAYARGKLGIDKVMQEAVAAAQPISQAADAYMLKNANIDVLLKRPLTEPVCQAIIDRPNASAAALRSALSKLAEIRQTAMLPMLLELLRARDAAGEAAAVDGLGKLLAEQPAADLRTARGPIEKLASDAKLAKTRQFAVAAWIGADGSGDAAFLAASRSKDALRDALAAVPLVADQRVRGGLYANVRPLIFELPPGLAAEAGGGVMQSGMLVDVFEPHPKNLAVETLAGLTPKASGLVPEISLKVPQRSKTDRYALRFTGVLQAAKAGQYTFAIKSDDGARLYIDDKLVFDNESKQGKQPNGNVELTAGQHRLVVTYGNTGGGEGLDVTWSGPGFSKQKIAADRLSIGGGEETVHDVAIRALGAVPGHDAEKFRDLVAVVKADRHRPAAIAVLRKIPEKARASGEVPELVDNILGYLSSMPAAFRTSPAAQEAVTLVKSLAAALPAERAKAVADRLDNLDVRVIAVGTVVERMIYDKEFLAVQAGAPVEFRFTNTDNMPHNFVIVAPGSLEEVGLLAEATSRDADAKDRQFVPRSDRILLASRLLEPGQTQALSFEAPKEPGIYPYVCTYPGHWRRMYGALYVVADLPKYLADPEAYLAAAKLPLRDELLASVGRNTEWKYDDLIGDVAKLQPGRSSFEVGRKLFAVANCVGCHKLNGEGRELGPDLVKIEPAKHTAEYLLRSICEPSQEIAEKFQSHTFVLDSGKVVTGMILEETPTACTVMVDPLARCEPVVVTKAEVDERSKSPVSIMPKGLLNRLSREEILDLMAYVLARGDRQHPLFAPRP